MPRPEAVRRGGKFFQGVEVGGGEGLAEFLAPGVDGLDFVALEFLDDLVGIDGHAGVRHQPVVHGVFGPFGQFELGPGRQRLGQPRHAVGHRLGPAGFFTPASGLFGQQIGRVGLAPGADQRIAGLELQAEPRHVRPLVDRVEPQRDLGQLDGDGVEVHAEDVVVRQAHFYSLLFALVFVVADRLAGFLLLQAQVGVGKLADGLVLEGGGTKGHLAEGQVQDVGGGLVLQQFLQGVLHGAAGQAFVRVVGGQLFPVAPGEAIDVLAPVVLEQPPGFAGMGRLVHPFLFPVARQFLLRHEVGVDQRIVVLGGGLHFVEVGLGEEAGIGQQVFVDPTELVDAELGVGNAPGAPVPPPALPPQRQPLDHLLQDLVAEPHGVEPDLFRQRRVFGIEQMAFQRRDLEVVVDGFAVEGQAQLAGIAPLEYQPEQDPDGLVEEVSVAVRIGFQRHQLQVAQGLQRVAFQIVVALDGQVAQRRTGLEIEDEQKPVEVADAAAGQALLQLAVWRGEDRILADGAQMADGFVAQQFHALPDGILQILGNREGVPVGVLVEGVQQGKAFGRTNVLPVQEGRHGPQRAFVLAVEDFLQVEGQIAALGPLGAVDQAHLPERGQQDPAGRFFQREHLPGDDVVPVQFRPGKMPADLRVLLPRVAFKLGLVHAQRQRILPRFVGRCQNRQDPQQRRAGGFGDFGQDRQPQAVFLRRPPIALDLVAQRREEVPHPFHLGVQPGPGLLQPVHAVAQAEVGRRERAQLGRRRPMGFGTRMLGGGLLPAGHHVAQIALEQRQQVVLRVVLVDVRQSRQIERHGQALPFPAKMAAMRIEGWSSVSSVSRIQAWYCS